MKELDEKQLAAVVGGVNQQHPWPPPFIPTGPVDRGLPDVAAPPPDDEPSTA
jgi:bacteriocin-like protein